MQLRLRKKEKREEKKRTIPASHQNQLGPPINLTEEPCVGQQKIQKNVCFIPKIIKEEKKKCIYCYSHILMAKSHKMKVNYSFSR